MCAASALGGLAARARGGCTALMTDNDAVALQDDSSRFLMHSVLHCYAYLLAFTAIKRRQI